MDVFIAVMAALLAIYLTAAGIYFIVVFFGILLTSPFFWIVVGIIIGIVIILEVYFKR